MKTLILAVMALVLAGCNTQRLSKTTTTTTITNGVTTTVTATTEFRSGALFNNSSTKGLSVDSKTDKTSYGLKITGQTQEVDNQGIRDTFFGAGEMLGAGIVSGGKAAIKVP